jgi:hypothetical protein
MPPGGITHDPEDCTKRKPGKTVLKLEFNIEFKLQLPANA